MDKQNSSLKFDHGAHAHDEASTDQRAEYSVKDPVCGMDVDPHAAKHSAVHEGHPYYFCSAGAAQNLSPIPTPIWIRALATTMRCPKARSTPARCTHKFVRSAPVLAPYAAWHWSQKSSVWTQAQS